MNAIKCLYITTVLLLVFLITSVFVGCTATTMSPSEARRIGGLSTNAPGGADDFMIVSCLLPGQIRQMGRRMVYLTRRKAIKTTAGDCAIRGGEFAMPGQSDFTRALMVWMPGAEAGDKEAQYYVGEIYQRGLGSRPQYDRAVEWYRKSAEQGYTKAQMNLAYLYEKGLGVEKDPQQAERWYRRATGLGDAISLNQNTLSLEERRELEKLREEVNRRHKETRILKQKLKGSQKDLDDVRRKLNKRRKREQTQKQAVDQLTSQIDHYEQTIIGLRTQLTQKENKIKKLPKAGPNKKIEILKRKLKASRKDLEDTRRKLRERHGGERAQKQEVVKLTSQVSRHERTIEKLRAQLAENEEKIKNSPEIRLNQEIKALKQNLENSQKDLDDTRRKLKARHSGERTQEQTVAKLTSQVSRHEQTINKLRAQLAENEAIFKKLPAPRIEIFDSAPPTTRGIRVTGVQKGSKKRLIAGVVWAPAGLASFKVNRKSERVGPDGKFRIPVALGASGGNTIEFVAVDKRGQETRVTHSLTRSAKHLPSDLETEGMGSIDFGRYHALIIGNINYRKLPRLNTAAVDAREVAKVLRNKYGFEVTLLIDASRYDIIRALDNFRTTLTEKDNLLIYYAGHGFLDVKNNRGYWQPVDADMDSTANWISDYTITDQLNIMNAKEVLVIADSCYSGALTRSAVSRLEAAQSPRVRAQYIRQLAKGRARMVLSSGELAPVLDAGGGDHSVFANALLDVLESNDRILEGNRLHQEMSARVVYESKRFGLTQVPLYASNIQAGHASGDFIFVPLKKVR